MKSKITSPPVTEITGVSWSVVGFQETMSVAVDCRKVSVFPGAFIRKLVPFSLEKEAAEVQRLS